MVFLQQRVIIRRCKDYQVEVVKKEIESSIDLLGGIHEFITPGMKVALKPNLLTKKSPNEAVTTHPAVVEALAQLVKQAGAYPVIIDSPGGPEMKTRLSAIYKTTGMELVKERTGAGLLYSSEKIEIQFTGGSQYRKFWILEAVLNADLVINIPKLKTHSLTMMTCGVKNLFGVIPGLLKGEYHLTMQNKKNFAAFLVDLALFVKPGLTVVDGIEGMEGEGPSSGKPVRSDILLISKNVFNLDLAAAEFIGLKAEQVPTVLESAERGLCVGDIKKLDFYGSNKEITRVPYKLPKTIKQLNFKDRFSSIFPSFLLNKIYGLIKPVVKVERSRCTLCGICKESCPPRAITYNKRYPIIDMDSCIRCYCCQELCPEKAVSITYPLLGKLLFGRE